MKLLLDTHLLLWAAGGSDKLSNQAREMIENSNTTLFFSPASIWEIVIKSGLGRDDFEVDAQELRQGLLDHDYREIPITSAHAIAVASLPQIHKDPFDRMLLAQSIVEGVKLVTSDAVVARYPGLIMHV